MSQFEPVRFVDVQSRRPVLARAAGDGADAHHPQPACAARQARHPGIADAAQPAAAAALPAQPPQFHRAGVLGFRRRQVDRGGVLRAVASARRRYRGQDRGDRRRSRKGAGAGRLSQLLVSAARAGKPLDQPSRQPRALQSRPSASRAASPISWRPAGAACSTSWSAMSTTSAQTFGPRPDQKRGYCGHQEIELALIKPLPPDRRAQAPRPRQPISSTSAGAQPHYFDQEAAQARRGSRRISGRRATSTTSRTSRCASRRKVVGHAVRAMYMYSAMADLAAELEATTA